MTVDDLGRHVIGAIGIPRDSWEIAAQLEVLGMRDHDAREKYDEEDLFALARTIERRFLEGSYGFEGDTAAAEPQPNSVARFVRRYAAGMAFALPMAMQAAAMLVWGHGIWGAIDLSLRQGSAIALGFIASYIAAGGFVQAIVRRGLFYVYQEEPELARWTAWRGFAIAIVSMLALIVPALVFNLLFGVLPWSMVAIATLFYAGLAVLWLAWALLYLARRIDLIIVITAVALAVVILSARAGGAAPIVANAIGVAVADLLSLGAAALILRHKARKQRDGGAVNPPRLPVLVFSTSRYFVYGLLFNTFLFADRIIAWTTRTGRDDFPPYPFWLSVRYELAMDLALVVIIVMGGMIQHAIERFSEELVPNEKRLPMTGRDAFVREQRAAHRRRSNHLAVSAALSLALAWLTVVALQQVDDTRLRETLNAAVTMRVFAIAACAYVIFMFAVRNLLVLLTLSRVSEAVRCVAIALACNATVGFLCSRSIGYWAAVIGLLAGAAVMSFLASREVRRTLDDLDYTYYAAY